MVISRATLAYCLKLTKAVCDLNSFFPLWIVNHSKNRLLPLLSLRTITVILGLFISFNFSKLTTCFSRSCRGAIWALLLLGGLLYKLRESSKKTGKLLFEGFLLQLKVIDLTKSIFVKTKEAAISVEGRLLENLYLLIRIKTSYGFSFLVKIVIPLRLIAIYTFFL